MIEASEARTGWIESETGISYPPEPWFLGGTLAGSVFSVPRTAVPDELRANIPQDHQLVSFVGQVPCAVTFVHYAAGGVLAYEELLVALPVRSGLRVRCSVVQIWVDSTVSATGGRALWNIPKQLAHFERSRDGQSLSTVLHQGEPRVAEMRASVRGPLLPGRWQLPLTTAQHLAGRDVLSSNAIIGRLRRTRAHWHFAERGPLGWLNRGRAWADLMIDDAIVVFGQQVTRR